MGADQRLKKYHQTDLQMPGIMAITGFRIWPGFDLHYPGKRPIHHITRTKPSNLKYPMIKMSLPIQRPTTTPSRESVINIDDVYSFVERERAVSSRVGKRHTIEMGSRSCQSRLEMSRPQSCSSQIRKPRRTLPRRSTMDSIRLDSSCDHTLRPATATSGAYSDISSIVQQHCCELMGPSVCTACSKKNTILINRIHNQSALADSSLTTEDIATVSMVKRVLPHLSTSVIQEQLNNGGICHLQPVNCWNRDKYKSENEEEEGKQTPTVNLEKLRFQKVNRKVTTPMFFNNLRQMNQKIVTGSVDRNIGRFCSIKKEEKRSESPYPVFISPKKNSIIPEPRYKAYFEPPLLEKENQTDPFASPSSSGDDDDALLRQQPKRLDSDSEDNGFINDYLSTSRLEDGIEDSTEKRPFDPPLMPKENQIEEPAFFAGSVIPYTLPKRAPNKLDSFEMGRLNGELTSSDSDNESQI